MHVPNNRCLLKKQLFFISTFVSADIALFLSGCKGTTVYVYTIRPEFMGDAEICSLISLFEVYAFTFSYLTNCSPEVSGNIFSSFIDTCGVAA